MAPPHRVPGPYGYPLPGLSAPPVPGPNLALVIIATLLLTVTGVLALTNSLSQGNDLAYALGYATGATLSPCLIAGVVALFSKPFRLSNAALGTHIGLQSLFFLHQLAVSASLVAAGTA